MKKTIPLPIYLLLLAILVVFIMQLRETKALKAELKAELAGIRREQLQQPVAGPPLPAGAGVPVFVTNYPLNVSINR